jgi:hypothetical protein
VAAGGETLHHPPDDSAAASRGPARPVSSRGEGIALGRWTGGASVTCAGSISPLPLAGEGSGVRVRFPYCKFPLLILRISMPGAVGAVNHRSFPGRRKCPVAQRRSRIQRS